MSKLARIIWVQELFDTHRDERQVLGRHVKLVEALKVELVRLQRELIASQNKRAVLEEEIIRREKSHRWTTLKVCFGRASRETESGSVAAPILKTEPLANSFHLTEPQ